LSKKIDMERLQRMRDAKGTDGAADAVGTKRGGKAAGKVFITQNLALTLTLALFRKR
jgi:hypothetical protein